MSLAANVFPSRVSSRGAPGPVLRIKLSRAAVEHAGPEAERKGAPKANLGAADRRETVVLKFHCKKILFRIAALLLGKFD